MVLFNKKNSLDCNNLFSVEAVEVGVRREEEGRIACHPPLQVTTEGKKISQKVVVVVKLGQAGTMWAVLQMNENFSVRVCCMGGVEGNHEKGKTTH